MDKYLESYPPVLNVAQVAEILGVNKQSVRKLIDKRVLLGIRVGRVIRVPKDRLMDYLGKTA